MTIKSHIMTTLLERPMNRTKLIRTLRGHSPYCTNEIDEALILLVGMDMLDVYPSTNGVVYKLSPQVEADLTKFLRNKRRWSLEGL